MIASDFLRLRTRVYGMAAGAPSRSVRRSVRDSVNPEWQQHTEWKQYTEWKQHTEWQWYTEWERALRPGVSGEACGIL